MAVTDDFPGLFDLDGDVDELPPYPITPEEPLDESEPGAAPPVDPAPSGGDFKDRNDELFKKWSKSGDTGRFLTVRPWLDAGKVAIDIGETKGSGLTGATMVWANAVSLLTFLAAVRDGRGEALYPANSRAGVATAEGLTYYGGGKDKAGKPVSRVLKVQHWMQGESFDTSAFAWKCGHFNARTSNTGAYIPDLKSPISVHSIKMTRVEMAEMATALGLALVHHAARERDTNRWIQQASGKRAPA